MSNSTHIILFDGDCNLCNGTVRFIINRDPTSKFKFASLQSEKGQALLRNFNLSTSDFNTFVYINEDQYFTKSSAALRVLKELGGLWTSFYLLIIIPKKFRDFLYDIIVHNRYKWFGERDSCMVPTPELKGRFLY
ncbi:thiol-disulfide oxidoreductase DCC family protein [soil metagenome]